MKIKKIINCLFAIFIFYDSAYADNAIDMMAYRCLTKYYDEGIVRSYLIESDIDNPKLFEDFSFRTSYIKGQRFHMVWGGNHNIDSISIDYVNNKTHIRRNGVYEEVNFYQDYIAMSAGASSGLSSYVMPLIIQEKRYLDRMRDFDVMSFSRDFNIESILINKNPAVYVDDGMVKSLVRVYGDRLKFLTIIKYNILDYGISASCTKESRIAE
jgi:hypothetical protein